MLINIINKLASVIFMTYTQSTGATNPVPEISPLFVQKWVYLEGMVDLKLWAFCNKLLEIKSIAPNSNMYDELQQKITAMCYHQLKPMFPNLEDTYLLVKTVNFATTHIMPDVHNLLAAQYSTQWGGLYIALSIQQLTYGAAASAYNWLSTQHEVPFNITFLASNEMRFDMYKDFSEVVKLMSDHNVSGGSFVPKVTNSGVIRPDYYIPGKAYAPKFVNGIPIGGIVPKLHEGHPLWVHADTLIESCFDNQGKYYRTGADFKWLPEESYNKFTNYRQSYSRPLPNVVCSAELEKVSLEQEQASEYRKFLALSVVTVTAMVCAAAAK